MPDEIPGEDVPMPPEGYWEEFKTYIPKEQLEGLNLDE